MKSIKNVMFGLMAVLLVSMTTSCGWTTVGPREVGVKVNSFGSDKGVEMTPYGTGLNVYGPGSDMITYPVHNVVYSWTKDAKDGSEGDESFTFPIKGGLEIGVDLGVEFAISKALAPKVYSEYPYDLEGIKNIVIRQAINNALNEYGPKTSIDRFVDGGINDVINAVEKDVRNLFAKDGINIKKVSLINAPRYPEAVKRSIEAKINATQMAIARENELRTTEAEAKKVIAEAEGIAGAKKAEADGIAYYNIKAQQNLTPLLVEMERIKKWNGSVPQVTSGSTPMIDLRKN